jgi:8-oxo-dGTP pyrophosphatase MutT (NUDIX family)
MFRKGDSLAVPKEIEMTDAPTDKPVTPRPSAAIVLLRGSDGGGVEVFMVRRHVLSEFVPDVFVFPGGSVKPEDRETELAPGVCAPVPPGPTALGSGLRAAALRECFEEAGVLLAERRSGRSGDAHHAPESEMAARLATHRAALHRKETTLLGVAQAEELTLATDALLHWAHWITPEAMPKRFDTHFFLAAMPEGQQAAHDQLETTDSAWVTPEEALRDSEVGTFPLVFATIHQLRDLIGLTDVRSSLARFAGTTPRTIMPRLVTRDGATVIELSGEV